MSKVRRDWPRGTRNGKEWLTVPNAADLDGALDDFAKNVRTRFGPSNVELYWLSSADAEGESDPGEPFVAVVFADDVKAHPDRVGILADLAFDVMLDRGALIHARPIARTDWYAAVPQPDVVSMRAGAQKLD